jgi:hypothetical protein
MVLIKKQLLFPYMLQNLLFGFITERECVYCAIRPESLIVMQVEHSDLNVTILFYGKTQQFVGYKQFIFWFRQYSETEKSDLEFLQVQRFFSFAQLLDCPWVQPPTLLNNGY